MPPRPPDAGLDDSGLVDSGSGDPGPSSSSSSTSSASATPVESPAAGTPPPTAAALDRRHRCRACRELGIPLKVEPLAASDQAPLTYVMSANRHWRELSASPRAAVAVTTKPHISLQVNAKRVEDIPKTRRKRQPG